MDARPTRDDGLSIRRARPRHDEAKPPRGYELQPDGWPVWMPPKGSRKPTDEDRAIAHAVIHAVQAAIGESEHWKPGPKDTIMNDEVREHLEVAYKALTGRPWGYFDDASNRQREHVERLLANLLRLRGQALIYKRIRKYKGKPDAPRADGGRFVVPPPPPVEERKPGWGYHPGGVVDVPPIAVTGAEIVEHLRGLGALHVDLERTRPVFDDLAAGRLASLIDALPDDAINLGGAGGRSGGRTPEAWAHTLVLALTDPRAARTDYTKRRRRSGRRDDAP